MVQNRVLGLGNYEKGLDLPEWSEGHSKSCMTLGNSSRYGAVLCLLGCLGSPCLSHLIAVVPYSNHVTTKNKVPSPFSKCPLEDDIKFIEDTQLYNSQARNHLPKTSFPFFFFQVVLLELSLNKSQLKWDNHIFRVDWQILNKQWRVDRIYIILYICILFKLQTISTFQ